MKKFTIVACLLLLAHGAMNADIVIDDYMDTAQREKTGISKLNKNEIILLEGWLNKNFVPKNQAPAANELFLSENLSNGSLLKLSDGSIYEVNPQDIPLSSLWITPFPMEVTMTSDPNYPFLLMNKNTNTMVHARKPQIIPTPPNPLPPTTNMPVPSSNMPNH